METDDLTPAQRAAVEHVDGPLLVLAGPGSGKTRVITRRVARLVERGVDPREILAITFTNKASGEMADRVAALLPGTWVRVNTFHRFCARLLRRHAAAVGLRENYTIYDTSDQQSLVKNALSAADVDPTAYPPRRVLGRISDLKNDMVTAEKFAAGFDERVGDHIEAVVARVYPKYQRALLDANAVDFDDLLMHAVTLLEQNPDLRAELDDRFRFILVDEYQDTNLAQYAIVRALSHDHPNLMATGDPDQSIYGWRGAKIENILRFERDYPKANVVRLEENFRSTGAILRAADELIAHNVHRKLKTLKGVLGDGDEPRRLFFRDGRQEADEIAAEVKSLVEGGGFRPADVAVFYRVNSLSRELELAFGRHKVPYQVAAGTAFYDRAEVKDVLAYLRLIANPADRVAFERVVNQPKRGVGKTTQRRVLAFAESNRLLPVDAAAHADRAPGLSKRAANAAKKFADLVNDLTERSAGPVAPLVRAVIDDTGLGKLYGEMGEEEAARLGNLDELVTAAAQYDGQAGDGASLDGFLETTSLLSDADTFEDAADEAAGTVTLMTLHAAKGLEFPVVYVVGVEQNLLPHERSLRSHDPRELEEERRLLFVGVTRAMRRLAVCHARKRDVRGRPTHSIPSDFLTEMELTLDDRSGGDERAFGRWAAGGFDEEDFSQEVEWEHPMGVTPDDPHAGPTADTADTDIETDGFESAFGDPDAPPRTPAKSAPKLPALLTGADLLSGGGAAGGFAVEDMVRHPRYGLGRVTRADGRGPKRMVTVEFESDGASKTFRAAASPLQPVGNAPA